MVFHILFHPIWPIVRWGLVMVECRRMRTWMSYQDVGLSWLVLNAGCLSKRWSLLERGKALVDYTKCALVKLTWHRKISLLMHIGKEIIIDILSVHSSKSSTNYSKSNKLLFLRSMYSERKLYQKLLAFCPNLAPWYIDLGPHVPWHWLYEFQPLPTM